MFFGSLPKKDLLPKIITETYNQLEVESKSYLENFYCLFNKDPLDENLIINYIMKSPNILMLIKLSLIDEKLANWCKDQRLSEFWDEAWQVTYEGRVPQKYISSYQLMCGLILYNEAFQLIDHGFPKDSTDVMQLMIKSCNLGFFDALIFYSNVNECKLSEGKIENPTEIVIPHFNAAAWHGTPAFLLCALNYFRIGEHYALLDNLNGCEVAFQNSLTFIYLAEYFESEFGDAINNAYYGQGIKNSNPWKIQTIEQLKLHLINFFGLDTMSQSRALFAANQFAQKFSQQLTQQTKVDVEEKTFQI